MEQPDPSQIRIGDADRHRVAELLRTAAGDGRIDMAELDERLEATYAAKVGADLLPIVVDLPGGREHLPAHLVARPEPGWVPAQAPAPARDPWPAAGGPPRPGSSTAVLGSQKRTGVWVCGPLHQALAVMGEVVLDLRRADFVAPLTTIRANAVMGSVSVVVDPWTRVSVEGTGVMGDFSQGRDRAEPELGPRSPVVRVTGVAFMGSVDVRRKGLPDDPRGRRRWVLGG